MHQPLWIQIPLDKCKLLVIKDNQDFKTLSSFLHKDTFKMLVDNQWHKKGNLKQSAKAASQMIPWDSLKTNGMAKIPSLIELLITLITYQMEITNESCKISEKEDILMEKDQMDLSLTQWSVIRNHIVDQ